MNTNDIPESAMTEAKRFKAYFPYRIVTIALKVGEPTQVQCNKTMARANALIRQGWVVFKI